MSKQVDTRIVEMRFENDKFERGVAKTMSSLDKLKEKLAFKSSKNGFDDLQKSADKVSFEHLINAVDVLQNTIQHRTGIMGGVFEALGNKIVGIFDSAFSKVQNMINQVTLAPIETGFSEYELKVNSVQTIAANTGVLMRDVMNEMNGSGESMAATAEDLELAWRVINGEFGNGEERAAALADSYDTVQGLVNQITRGEIKMGQTIDDVNMSLGEHEYTMEDIEYVLDELNRYADRTIYNYAQMTDAIGKFTVAGVDLMDATSAVQGIANLGAFVGAGEQDTSRIMRELAQGLSTGIINLQDWKSLENSAGFAGTVFQDHLVDMADHLYETNEEYRDYIQSMHGEVGSIDELVKSYGKFRNSLTEGAWLNDTVLINTLHEFAGDWNDEMYTALGYTEQEITDLQALGKVAFDAATKSKTFTQMWGAVTEAAQSSWTTTWEYIFGHFYDARNLWTIVGDALSEVIEENNEARNEILKVWSETGGRDAFFSGIAHLFNFIKNSAGAVKEAWTALFPPMEGERLTEMSEDFERFTASLENMTGFFDILKSLGTVLFTFLKIGAVVITSLFDAIKVAFQMNPDSGLIDSLAFLTACMADFVENSLDIAYIGEKVFDVATNVLSVLSSLVFAAVAYLSTSVDWVAVWSTIVDVFKSALKILALIPITIVGVVVAINELSKEFLGFGIIDGIKMFADFLIGIIPLIVNKIKSGFALVKPVLANIKSFFSSIIQSGKNSSVVEKMSDGVTSILDKLAVDRDKGKTIASIGAALAQLFLVFQGIKAVMSTGKLSKGLAEIPESISDTLDSLKESFEDAGALAKTSIITAIAKSILILAISLGIMALIPSDKLKEVASVLVILMVTMIFVMKTLGGLISTIPNATIIQGATAMFLLAMSIAALVGSIAILSILDYDSMVQSVIMVGILMLMIAGLIKKFNHARFRSNIPKVAAGIFIITQAVSSLAMLIAVMSIVARFNSAGMWEAFGLVTAIFAEIIILYYVIVKLPFSGSGKKLIAMGTFITLMAGAITAIGVLIAALSVIVALDKGNNILLAAGLVTGILVVMGLMAFAFAGMSKIPFNPLGAITLSASLVIVVGALIGFIVALGMIIAIQNAAGYDNMGKHLLTLFGIIGMMILMIGMLRSIHTSQVVSIIAVALAINTISFAIFTIAEGLLILSELNFDSDKVKTIIIGVGVAFIALLAFIYLISKLSGTGNAVNRTTNVIFGNTSPIHKFIEGLALLLLSISVSIWLIVDAINKIMDAADRFNSDSNMVEKITNLFKGVAQAFANSWSYIVEAIDNAGVSEDLDRWFKSMLDHLVDTIAYLLADIVGLVALAVTFIVDAIIEALNALAGFDLNTYADLSGENSPIENMFETFTKDAKSAPINKLVNALIVLLAIVTYELGDAIMANSPVLVEAMWHLMESLGYLFLTILAFVDEIFIPEFDTSMLSGYIQDIGENFWELTVDGYNTYIKPALEKLGKSLLRDFINFLFLPVVGIVEGFAGLANKVIDGINKIAGYNMIDHMDTSGLYDFYDSVMEKFNLVEKESEAAGEAVEQASTKMQLFNDKVASMSGKQVGADITVNPTFSTNDASLNNQMFAAMDNAGNAGIKGFNKAWEINSPSKVGEETGGYIGEGLINGFSNVINSPETQTKITSLKDTLTNKLNFQDSLNTDGTNIDLSPQQVYNLDTSTVGDSLMTGGFGDTFSGIGTNIGNTTSSLADMNSVTQEMSDTMASEGGKFYDDTDVVNELSGLREDVLTLSRAMAQIKMVLDTNKLVGEMVAPMDAALARRASRVSRGG